MGVNNSAINKMKLSLLAFAAAAVVADTELSKAEQKGLNLLQKQASKEAASAAAQAERQAQREANALEDKKKNDKKKNKDDKKKGKEDKKKGKEDKKKEK